MLSKASARSPSAKSLAWTRRRALSRRRESSSECSARGGVTVSIRSDTTRRRALLERKKLRASPVVFSRGLACSMLVSERRVFKSVNLRRKAASWCSCSLSEGPPPCLRAPGSCPCARPPPSRASNSSSRDAKISSSSTMLSRAARASSSLISRPNRSILKEEGGPPVRSSSRSCFSLSTSWAKIALETLPARRSRSLSVALPSL
mmetsp:Transcript_67211/g.160369  ORF Transcript_67211/g.160369 Transcript_67211/m.160369 type:complete len:205 (+) Transcript_67211:218-832(+)